MIDIYRSEGFGHGTGFGNGNPVSPGGYLFSPGGYLFENEGMGKGVQGNGLPGNNGDGLGRGIAHLSNGSIRGTGEGKPKKQE